MQPGHFARRNSAHDERSGAVTQRGQRNRHLGNAVGHELARLQEGNQTLMVGVSLVLVNHMMPAFRGHHDRGGKIGSQNNEKAKSAPNARADPG